MNRYLCIHGHFYQPPRENAWLESVEIQDSAYPFHDWNERITAECYAPNTASRILDSERHIIDIVNNYSRMSFNFGPTLLSWMETHSPEVYQAILEADKKSQKRFSGHGSALAQVYNHMIMPLANHRDKYSQVYWGIRDFEYRFGRKPEGMWLPETAVDTATLEVLADFEILFTILSPYQAAKIRKIGEKEWTDVTGGKVDPKMPYLCQLPSGKKINLFFYDGPVSQELGFGDLLNNGENFANRLVSLFSDSEDTQMVHIATDGETYGHHRYRGDMALAYCLYHIEEKKLAKLTIYGEYLEKHPPTHEMQIVEKSSWSCVHGVERWKSNCGCNTGMRAEWNQEWRGPLREALNWLREELIHIYEKEAAQFLRDSWQARDAYIDVILDRTPKRIDNFLRNHTQNDPDAEDKSRILKMLEMQRYAMLMYTSCGWFFDELSGIETTQVIQYAARAIQLANELTGKDPEPGFIQMLEKAPSNIPEHLNGAKIYGKFIKPSRLDLMRVGAHLAVSSLFEEYPESTPVFCYSTWLDDYERLKAGKMKIGIGRARIRSDITWNETHISFAVLHLGGHILNGGVREFMGKDAFDNMQNEIKETFRKSDIPEIIRLMDHHFGTHNYSLWHLFKDEQRKVFNQMLQSTFDEVEIHFRQIYNDDYAIMQAMKDMDVPIPKALITPAEFILNSDLRRALENDELNLEIIKTTIDEFHKWEIQPDVTSLNFIGSQKINSLMNQFSDSPEKTEIMDTIKKLIEVLDKLPLKLNFWEAQNIYFFMGKNIYRQYVKKVEKGDNSAKEWVEQFTDLGNYLKVRIK